MSHDPLPPLDSIDIYKRATVNDRAAHNSTNFISLFFSSLFTGLNSEAAADALNGLYLL